MINPTSQSLWLVYGVFMLLLEKWHLREMPTDRFTQVTFTGRLLRSLMRSICCLLHLCKWSKSSTRQTSVTNLIVVFKRFFPQMMAKSKKFLPPRWAKNSINQHYHSKPFNQLRIIKPGVGGSPLYHFSKHILEERTNAHLLISEITHFHKFILKLITWG